MATFKHISSKNADYGAAEQYLTFEHDEFTMKPTLDGNERQSRRKGMERKGEAERSNSSRGYHGRYLTYRSFCVTVQFYSPAKIRIGAPGCRSPALGKPSNNRAVLPLKRYISLLSWRQGFPSHFYTFRTSFLRVQVNRITPFATAS